MGNKLLKSTIILVLIISSQQGIVSIYAQSTGETKTFIAADNYEFNGYIQSFLTWKEDQNYLLTLNLTLDAVPDSESRIEFAAFTFQLVAKRNGIDRIIAQDPLVVENLFLSRTVNSIAVNSTLNSPDEDDRFYINIDFFARTKGNITQTENKLYSIRFPDDGKTIIVSRDALGQLVNLYGSPPSSFFQNWFPVYGFFIMLLLVPAFTLGIHHLRFGRKTERIDHTNNLENEDTSEEVIPNE